MPKQMSLSGSELFIVDNSYGDWKVLRYLHDWCEISKAVDIATGYFEIGSLLALDGVYQKVDDIRILMGCEVSRRTLSAFKEALVKHSNLIRTNLDASIESEKDQNDFLLGVPAIVEAIHSGRIKCRVYRKDKFHAKAYITHARMEVVGSSALVGSSNFTVPGLSENVELNVQITGVPVKEVQEWYEEHWKKAEDVTPELLEVIERHTREYMPFDVYAKALQEYFRGHEVTASEWEKSSSRMYKILDGYQQEGYRSLLKIAAQYGGSFLCDGVGLGKTYVGLMLIERLVMHDRKRVALFVPKSAREDVWERDIRRYLPNLSSGVFSNLQVFNHTDLMRTSDDMPAKMERIKEMADVVIVDEAHHFRNTGLKGEDESTRKSRYWHFFDLVKGKELYMLTATPVNNKLVDLRHMIELFTQGKNDYFKDAPLGIHSLQGHFSKLEKALEKKTQTDSNIIEEAPPVQTNQVEAEEVLWSDDLFRALVVQRSRAYVKESQIASGSNVALFPKREAPRVAEYELKKTYGSILDMIEKAFEKDKPLLALAIYYPMAYYVGPDLDKQEKAFLENRQQELVGLIRTQFLKRFESSVKAFEFSCENMLIKMLAWVTKNSTTDNEKFRLFRWKEQHDELINKVKKSQMEAFGNNDDSDVEEDIVPLEMLEAVEELSREEYKVEEILAETYLDLDQITEFLKEIKKFKTSNDDKLKKLVKLLKSDSDLKNQKVLIFTEFMTTARYLEKQLIAAGLDGVDEVDSARGKNRSEIIRRFAPYYNQRDQMQLFKDKETRILISTDVLSEGLNLQDATRLINYDIHWNPVRLMQRIGRVDRRLNPSIEAEMLRDRPELKDSRGRVVYWNFLPPDELDKLLKLYTKVSKKTLRISKVFGIEGKKLLKPDDDYDALKDFEHLYEGTPTELEAMYLEFQHLVNEFPDLESKLNALPGRVFSGKKHINENAKAVFFCYALPAPPAKERKSQDKILADEWTEEAGFTKWYLYDLATGRIIDEPSDIIDIIRSTPETPRHCSIERSTLSEIRIKLDAYIKDTYLKKVQAPQFVKPTLKCWMELN